MTGHAEVGEEPPGEPTHTNKNLILTINYLFSEGGIDGNALTVNGFTALDLPEQYPRDSDTMKIQEILTEANIKRANDLNTTEELSKSCYSVVKQLILMIWKEFLKNEPRWFKEARGNLLVAATVIASMAFQVALNPPGGVWQESIEKGNYIQKAGYSISATHFPDEYKSLLQSTLLPSWHL
ncbi:hypothetical protein LguiA_022323 [Lonicera macranthoides]